jgi:four helix bundle protein
MDAETGTKGLRHGVAAGAGGVITSFRDLVAWQKGMSLASAVYRVTAGLPPDERFGLTSQMRRAAVAIPSNIAEGYGRRARADYVRFLNIALGSAYELDTQLTIAQHLGFIADQQYEPVLADVHEVQRVLAGLIRSIERASPRQKS